MEPPLLPRHRPEDHEIPDGMRLLYDDLPQRREPPPNERGRLELLVGGIVAAAGVALVGAGVVGDLVKRARPIGDNGFAAPRSPFVGSTGVERTVDPAARPLVGMAEVEVVEEIVYTPPTDLRDGAKGRVIADPAPLPPTGVGPRPVGPVRTPRLIEPLLPVEADAEPVPTTVPETVATTSTLPPIVPPASTLPSTPAPRRDVTVFAASIGFTASTAMVETVEALGFDGWVEQQLDPTQVPDPIVDAALVGFDLLEVDPVELRSTGRADTALAQSRWNGFVRGYVSERQLHESMISMWREWFAIGADSADQVRHDRLIRQASLGPFRSLVRSLLESPGILRMAGADRAPVAGRQIPTGLARMVLERLTVGPGVASEADIAGAAVVFSGWTVDPAGRFVYDTGAHVSGSPSVLGWTTSGAGGVEDGWSLLDHLAARPETARRVATAVCTRLLGDGVTDSVIERSSTAYLSADTGVASVARIAMLAGDAALGSTTARRGGEWVTAALRALGATVDVGQGWDPDSISSVAGHLRAVGDQPGFESVRSGIADVVGWWESPTAVARRWTVARRLTGSDGQSGIAVDIERLRPSEDLPASSLIIELAYRLDATRLAPDEHRALLGYLGVESDQVLASVDTEILADLAALILSFPSFMRRDGGQP